MAINKILGRVQPVYQGEYSASKTYSMLDRVLYNSAIYECVKDSVQNIVPTNTTYWNKLTGPQGVKGDTGPQGEQGITVLVGVYDDYYTRPNLFTNTFNTNTVTIPAGLTLKINGTLYTLTSNVNVSDTSNSSGKDVYIYACVPTSGTEPTFVASLNSTVPDGYTAETSRKIGGFHTLCTSVGSISGHNLSGLNASSVLPNSIWDLKHRPVSDPEGMVFYKEKNIWVDIYLASWSGSKLVSTYGGVIADGGSSKRFHGELFCEKFAEAGKRMAWRHEFMSFAKGSNECTNIKNSFDPNTTGGHYDTNSRRMISNIGCEDCCGVIWQWVEDLQEGGAYGTINKNSFYLNGYGWDSSIWGGNSLYNSYVDSQSYGQMFGILRRLSVGGGWDYSSFCGSRSAAANHLSSHDYSRYGSRGVSEPRNEWN